MRYYHYASKNYISSQEENPESDEEVDTDFVIRATLALYDEYKHDDDLTLVPGTAKFTAAWNKHVTFERLRAETLLGDAIVRFVIAEQELFTEEDMRLALDVWIKDLMKADILDQELYDYVQTKLPPPRSQAESKAAQTAKPEPRHRFACKCGELCSDADDGTVICSNVVGCPLKNLRLLTDCHPRRAISHCIMQHVLAPKVKKRVGSAIIVQNRPISIHVQTKFGTIVPQILACSTNGPTVASLLI